MRSGGTSRTALVQPDAGVDAPCPARGGNSALPECQLSVRRHYRAPDGVFGELRARARLVTSSAGAIDQALKMFRQSEDARPQVSSGSGRRPWPFNAKLGNVAFAIARGGRDRAAVVLLGRKIQFWPALS